MEQVAIEHSGVVSHTVLLGEAFALINIINWYFIITKYSVLIMDCHFLLSVQLIVQRKENYVMLRSIN